MGLLFMIYLLSGDDFDLHQSALGQVLHSKGSPGGALALEELGIDCVHSGTVVLTTSARV